MKGDRRVPQRAGASAAERFLAMCETRFETRLEHGAQEEAWSSCLARRMLAATLCAWTLDHGVDRLEGFASWAYDAGRLDAWAIDREEAGLEVPASIVSYLRVLNERGRKSKDGLGGLETHGYCCQLSFGPSSEREFAELACEASERLREAMGQAGWDLNRWPESAQRASLGATALRVEQEKLDLSDALEAVLAQSQKKSWL